jgi:hypothetical protein
VGFGICQPATDGETEVFSVGSGIAVVVPAEGFELVEDVDSMEVNDQLFGKLGIDDRVVRVIGKGLQVADDWFRGVVHRDVLSARSDSLRCVVDILFGDLKSAVQGDAGEGIDGDRVDEPWSPARDLMESGDGSVGEEIWLGTNDVEVMSDVGAGAVFVERDHFKAERDALIEMPEHGDPEASSKAFMSRENNHHRIKGVHPKVEEHRQLDKGFLRNALGIVEDDDREATGGVDPVTDGSLEVGEELGLAEGVLPGELLVELAEEIIGADGAQRQVDDLVVGLGEAVDPSPEGSGLTRAGSAGEEEEAAMLSHMLQASDEL